jgi:hypothetical protein
MNMVMWLEDAKLVDTVIFNPIQYFVEPATKIVCKLNPTEGDATTHETNIHRQANIVMREDYSQLQENATVSNALADFLLQEYGGPRVDKIKYLMVKYGLMAPKIKDDSTVEEFVVPALLPPLPPSSILLGMLAYNTRYKSTQNNRATQ